MQVKKHTLCAEAYWSIPYRFVQFVSFARIMKDDGDLISVTDNGTQRDTHASLRLEMLDNQCFEVGERLTMSSALPINCTDLH